MQRGAEGTTLTDLQQAARAHVSAWTVPRRLHMSSGPCAQRPPSCSSSGVWGQLLWYIFWLSFHVNKGWLQFDKQHIRKSKNAFRFPQRIFFGILQHHHASLLNTLLWYSAVGLQALQLQPSGQPVCSSTLLSLTPTPSSVTQQPGGHCQRRAASKH